MSRKEISALSFEQVRPSNLPSSPVVGNDKTRGATEQQLATIPQGCERHGSTVNRQFSARGPSKKKPWAASPQKSKTATRTKQPSASPSKTRPIYSFFNAVTASQTSSSPSRPKSSAEAQVLEDEVEEIEDEEPAQRTAAVETSIKTATRVRCSNTAIAFRKRARSEYAIEEGGSNAKAFLGGSQKFLKTSDGQKKPVEQGRAAQGSSDQRPWAERFGPVNLDELAVHKKKINDVRQEIHAMLEGTSKKKILILKGPAGCGKTETLRLLAESMHFSVNEWKNPVSSVAAEDGVLSISAQFEEFIGSGSLFGALDLVSEGTVPLQQPADSTATGARELLLIEEFPNTLMRSPFMLKSFRSTIHRFLASNDNTTRGKRMILILSEALLSTSTPSVDSFTAHRLLGSDILHHAAAKVIEFNPIAPTAMSKALNLVVVKEARRTGRRRAPGAGVIRKLSELGDIRNAVASLEFLCLKGDTKTGQEGWGAKVAFSDKPGKAKQAAPVLTKMEEESMESVTQRESSLGLFHAVGKCVYNKRELPPPGARPQGPEHLQQYARPGPSEVNPENLLNDLGTDIGTFLSTLYENYILSCHTRSEEDTLDALCGCSDHLSLADVLNLDRFQASRVPRNAVHAASSDSLRQAEMSFETAVRGVIFSLPYPVKRKASSRLGEKRDAFKMYYPAAMRLWKEQEEVQSLLDMYTLKSVVPDEDRQLPAALDPFCSVPSSSARDALLLETIPYSLRILQGNAKYSQYAELVEDFEKMVPQLRSTIGAADDVESIDDDDDDDDNGGAVNGNGRYVQRHRKMKTDNTRTARPPERGLRAYIAQDPSKLDLTDDEIEDA